MKNTNNAEKRVGHSLDSIVITKDHLNWEERVNQWNSSMEYDDRVSWLHINHVREGNGPEKFIFYLDLADRYGEEDIFTGLPGHKEHIFTLRSYESPALLKSRLSKKAFSILCTEFFSKKEGNAPCPCMVPYKEPLFSKLLWFFRPYRGDGAFDNLRPINTEGLGNDGGRHYVSIANEFARRFALDAWELLNHRWCHDGGPDPKVAEEHFCEIVLLLRHLDLLRNMGELGQYMPTLQVFKKMVQFVLDEKGISFENKSLDDVSDVGKLLEPLVKSGNKLARTLFVTRLNVYK